ncbi:hypothetical protein [Prescottella equi]|uniref:Uncharacterized protein n=1 Tax=Rhodococcus hoagii TaxID=43767 RepID=A0AAE5IST4_RHOHA|nr:hypothetical protein [Prescottella equi]ERN45565.1 hemerythrin HHE cation binding domain-containing protein [Prescottella equi NBRC 101255 = C 7]MBM4630550.1 hypothetical protein [Prescottella equi]ORL27061.1 hypothetical protein A6I89_13685 [Prescottella equi]ORM00412.1 hypothetical protein A5N73_15535 [Prescottella equi]ORM27048.1 hypothetical protein A5N68_11155 [Prescottella equi]
MTGTTNQEAAVELQATMFDLLGRMAALERDVFRTVGASDAEFAAAHRAVVDFAEFTLRPWHRATEESLYPAAAPVVRAQLLVEGLLGEWQTVEQAYSRLSCPSTDRVRVTADISALRVLLVVMLGKCMDLLVPALADDGVPLADAAQRLAAAVAHG